MAEPSSSPTSSVTTHLLVPVDGSASAEHAVHYAVEIAKTMAAARHRFELDLINVQTPIVYGEIRVYVSEEKIRQHAMMAGERALAGAKAILDNAGVPYAAHVGIGDPAATVAEFVVTHGITGIVMGTRGMGAVGNLVLGSVATKLIHAVTVPVTLVR